MKREIFATVIIFLALNCSFGQNFTSLVVQVLDSRTNLPIEDAVFVIEETGFQKGVSNKEGKIYFENSVPLGRIHYRITRKDYELFEDYFNTTNASDNTLVVRLNQERQKTRDKILVTGEVTDGEGMEVINAQVEIRLGNITKRTNTDISGNYLIEIDMAQLLYQSEEILIEVKQNGCRKAEIIELLDKNYFTKDIVLICKSTLRDDSLDSSENSSKEKVVEDNWIGYWRTNIEDLPNQEVILEIKRDVSGRLVGEYVLAAHRIGHMVFYDVFDDSIKAFWFVATPGGRLEVCGDSYYELSEDKESFRGRFQVLNRPGVSTQLSWHGVRN